MVNSEHLATSIVGLSMDIASSGRARRLVTSLVLATAIGGCGKADQDKLKDNNANLSSSVASTIERDSLGRQCASKGTFELVKRELFRRAAETRGDDDPTFEPVLAGSTLRLDHPAAQSQDGQIDSVTCSATATLTLPDGMVAAGGRSSLSADINYVVQPAADQSGPVATITNADDLTIRLASIARPGTAGAPITEPARLAPGKQVPAAASPPRQPSVAQNSPTMQPESTSSMRNRASGQPDVSTTAPPEQQASPRRSGGEWSQTKVVEQGPLRTRIFLDRSGQTQLPSGETFVRIRYVGTLEGQAPVETITEEAVNCVNRYHTQQSYVVRNAQGRVVAKRGLQSRKRVMPGSLLSGVLTSICSGER